ncbi:hypothetical protein quinque_004114 [Culex quinquefasciatus]
MKLFGWLLLLVGATTAHYINELGSYIATAIFQLALREPRIMDCVFIDMNRKQSHSVVITGLVQQPDLSHVVKYVLDREYGGDPFAFPQYPALVLIDAGNSVVRDGDVPRNIRRIIGNFKPHTKLLVLIDVTAKKYFDFWSVQLSGLCFCKVAFLGLDEEIILRNTMKGTIWKAWNSFPSLDDLFMSNTRNMGKRPVVYSTTTPFQPSNKKLLEEFDVNVRWIEETAQYLNTTAWHYVNKRRNLSTVSHSGWNWIDDYGIDIMVNRAFYIGSFDESSTVFSTIPETLVVLVPIGRQFNVIELFLAPFTTAAWITLLAVVATVELQLLDAGMKLKIRFAYGIEPVLERVFKESLVDRTESLFEMDGINAYGAGRAVSELYLSIFYFNVKLQRTTYVILDETFGMRVAAFMTSFRNPLKEIFEYTHQVLVESGLHDLYIKQSQAKVWTIKKRYTPTKLVFPEDDMLGIEDLLPAWIALGAGLICGSFAIVVEFLLVLDSSTLMFDPDEDEDEFFFHGMKQTHRDITKRVKKKLAMEYDSVFDAEANNEDIFRGCTQPLVTSVMDGYNCSVFVYGATGAGKTFTMLGSDECPGITFLTMRELFRQIETLSGTRKFDIGISYLEVYNELVMNLLTKTGPLKLREDSHGVVVSGLVLKQIHNAEELLELLALGNQNRTQHPTDANAESSRSHAIFQVHIRMVDKTTGQKKTVKLSMIDLAGSERAASTKGIGIRFKEGANINKSLLALGNCINKLADGLKHIPYRDSNLTRILKDSLGGNCQTVMIANVSPSSLTYEDTYNTLKYASRAKKIRTTLRQNIVPTNVPKEYLVKKVNEQAAEIDRLKAKLKELEELAKAKVASPPAAGKFGMPDAVLLNTWRSRIDNCYAIVKKAQEHYFNLQSKEKVLNLRSKLKEQAEIIKKIVTLDGKHLNEVSVETTNNTL